MAEGRPVPSRVEYPWFHRVTTRWMDNDAYGHVNNAHYYAYFDSAINAWLVERGGFDPRSSPVVGYVVSSSCDYFAPVAWPEAVEVGVRVDRLGTSSARYAVALFREGDDRARAAGAMVHVFVDRSTDRSVPIPEPLRAALQLLHRA